MNAGFLSAYQFSLEAEGFDTIVVTFFDAETLDPASPVQASWLVGQALADRIQSRFAGRVTRWEGGPTLSFAAHSGVLSAHSKSAPHTVRYGVIITDRSLTQPMHRFESDGVQWILFDWWQFIRSKIAENRHHDAFLYLCMANPIYRTNETCKSVGWTEDVMNAMSSEGVRLFDAMEEEIALALTTDWCSIA